MKTLYDKLEGFRNKHTYLYVFLIGLLTLIVFISGVLVFFYLFKAFIYLFSNFLTLLLSVLFITSIVMLIGANISKTLDDWYGQ